MLATIMRDRYDHPEKQYLTIVKEICLTGDKINGRNGYTYSKNGASMYFSLENNVLPIMTTKKVAIQTCLKELFWFLSGSTDNAVLQKQNVHIWDQNADTSNDLGPIYGHQWRHFNAPYVDCNTDYSNQGIDQIQYIIDCLKDPEKRYSRRLVLSAWNPCQLEQMALPPCHILMQFHVSKDELSCSLYQRSGDLGLGVPFNILSYCTLTHLIAHHCNLKAKSFIYHIGNAHVYDDHLEPLLEQVKKEPYEFPKLTIVNKYDSIYEYNIRDLNISNYVSHENVLLKMRK
jgi:thymidylate synthase